MRHTLPLLTLVLLANTACTARAQLPNPFARVSVNNNATHNNTDATANSVSDYSSGVTSATAIIHGPNGAQATSKSTSIKLGAGLRIWDEQLLYRPLQGVACTGSGSGNNTIAVTYTGNCTENISFSGTLRLPPGQQNGQHFKQIKYGDKIGSINYYGNNKLHFSFWNGPTGSTTGNYSYSGGMTFYVQKSVVNGTVYWNYGGYWPQSQRSNGDSASMQVNGSSNKTAWSYGEAKNTLSLYSAYGY